MSIELLKEKIAICEQYSHLEEIQANFEFYKSMLAIIEPPLTPSDRAREAFVRGDNSAYTKLANGEYK